MTTEAQREQHERRRVLAQDASLRDQTGTYMSHTHDDIHQGRFAAIGPAVVVGSTAVPQYPAAAAHQRDPCGQEPPLGYRIDELEPSSLLAPPEAQAPDPTSDDAPSSVGQRTDVGSLSSDDPTTGGPAPPSASPRAQRGGVGSSPAFRRLR